MATVQNQAEADHSVIVNRPLEDWPLSQLVQEIEADYNDGREIRFEVLSELIMRAESAAPLSR